MPFHRGRKRAALLAACLTALSLCVTVSADAAPKSFAKADAAWHSGELEQARDLYDEALGAGGLLPDEVVIAYSRIGTVKAAMKDTDGALSAFRIAAAIDPAFELPPDSGPKAKQLYEKAREEAESQGLKLDITMNAPQTVPRKEPFSIDVEIPEGFAVLVAEVVVTLEEKSTGKAYRKTLSAAPQLSFEFPGKVAQAGARYKVTASAVDSQKNAWAVSEAKLKVEGKSLGGAAKDDEDADEGPATWGNKEVDPFAEEGKKDEPKEQKKKNFFMTPLGLGAGGAAVVVLVVGGILLFGGSSDTVSVKAPEWR